MSYNLKYASTFYGAFREDAKLSPILRNIKAYQMDTGNSNKTLIETELDILEGAGILTVKSAWSYLDVIRMIKDNYNLHLATYNVSGEYDILKLAVNNRILS